MGREPGGCGLAATLQLVARDLVPPASRSDEGEDILLDTHTHARIQLGTSLGGSSRLERQRPGGGRDSASGRESAVRTAWHWRQEDTERENRSRPDCCSFESIQRDGACRHCHRGRQRLCPSRAGSGSASVSVPGKEDANLLLHSSCGPLSYADSDFGGCP